MSQKATKKIGLAALLAVLLMSAVAYGLIYERSRSASSAAQASPSKNKASGARVAKVSRRTFDLSTLYSDMPVEQGNKSTPMTEINLEEAKQNKKMKVLVPKYLPTDAKLDAVWNDNDRSIIQNYDRGKNWIEITTRPETTTPDFAKEVNDFHEFDRVKADGTKEKVRTNADAVYFDYRPDGSVEPIPGENKQLVTIKGLTMFYDETKSGGTIRYGKNPREDGASNFGGLGFWKDGTTYGILGTNISLDELTKIVESMLE